MISLSLPQSTSIFTVFSPSVLLRRRREREWHGDCLTAKGNLTADVQHCKDILVASFATNCSRHNSVTKDAVYTVMNMHEHGRSYNK